MNKLRMRGAAAVCVFAVLGASATVPADLRAQADAVDPEAVELLRRTTEWLTSQQHFSVDAQNTFEDVLESGHRVDYELSSTSTVSRPDKLRSERHGPHINQIFYFDGTTLTLHNPHDKVYATEGAPATIEEMFQFAYDSLGLGVPISDLVIPNSFPLLMQEVTLAMVVGTEVVNGVHCQHLLFSRPGVDFQIWVAVDGPPVPLKYMVTDTETPLHLSISTFMTNWNLDPALSDTLFTFVPPEGAQEITFLRADETLIPQN